jgi:hypothetical protein
MANRRMIAPILSMGVATCQMRLALSQSQENSDSKNPVDKMRQLVDFNHENFDMKNIEISLYDLIENGAPGKIGYGFMMGYSSGFCLKKVSRRPFLTEKNVGVQSGGILPGRIVYSCSDPFLSRISRRESRKDPKRGRGESEWLHPHSVSVLEYSGCQQGREDRFQRCCSCV